MNPLGCPMSEHSFVMIMLNNDNARRRGSQRYCLHMRYLLKLNMYTLRRQSTSLGRSLVAGRTYASNAPTAPGITGAAHTPKPGSPIASANPSEADPQNLYQAPNHPSTWSTSQNPKKHAFSGPRFEQVNFSLQPQPISAMAMVAEDPVRLVPGRKATCDGGRSTTLLIIPEEFD